MWNYNYCIYITTNPGKTVLYIGVTNDLKRRLFEHYEKKGKIETFAGKYHCYHLLYYEHFISIDEAIKWEKELKGWSRKKKENLIKVANPNFDFIQLD